jgi:hypothetical protein
MPVFALYLAFGREICEKVIKKTDYLPDSSEKAFVRGQGNMQETTVCLKGFSTDEIKTGFVLQRETDRKGSFPFIVIYGHKDTLIPQKPCKRILAVCQEKLLITAVYKRILFFPDLPEGFDPR